MLLLLTTPRKSQRQMHSCFYSTSNNSTYSKSQIQLGVMRPNQFNATNTPKYVLKIVLADQLVATPPHVHENILHLQNYAYKS
jgi:hypothetical protein